MIVVLLCCTSWISSSAVSATTTNPGLQASLWMFILSPGAAKTMAITALGKVSLGPLGFQSDKNVGEGGFKAKVILWPLTAKDFRVTPIPTDSQTMFCHLRVETVLRTRTRFYSQIRLIICPCPLRRQEESVSRHKTLFFLHKNFTACR